MKRDSARFGKMNRHESECALANSAIDLGSAHFRYRILGNHQDLFMKNRTLQLSRAICLSVLASAACLSTAYAATPASTPPMSHGDMQGMDMKGMDMKGMGTMGSTDMKAHMMKSMQGMQSMTMTGNTDKDFAMMMRMHHQCGVEMAEMQLANGKDAEMKAMAKKIITAQKKEVAELDAWLAKHK